MICFCPEIFLPLNFRMLECTKFGDCKIKTIQIEDEWFESVRHIGIALGIRYIKGDNVIIYLRNINFKEKKLILTTIMMAISYLLQYLVHAGSYKVQHILIDMTLMIFLFKDIIIYKTRPGKHKKQGMWRLMVVYLRSNIIENTSILCLN